MTLAAALPAVALLCALSSWRNTADRCVEERVANETCSSAFVRSPRCDLLYETFRCCLWCDPCGLDGRACAPRPSEPTDSPTAAWVSPSCPCDRVVVMGACSTRGCAKPDALGVYSRRPGRRSRDGRHVYVRDAEQPSQLHAAGARPHLGAASRRLLPHPRTRRPPARLPPSARPRPPPLRR